MSILITAVAILQSFAVSLGVGSSTLAILNFFGAIADGTIDATERRMMGIVYVVLRVAMVAILVTSAMLLAYEYSITGLSLFSVYDGALLIILFVLFLNAALMSARLMPSTFGPALQAGSWYALGALAAVQGLGLVTFTFGQFIVGYILGIILVTAVVNGVMSIMKSKPVKRKKN